ncbi:DALR domain-containing protein, partial [Tychonema sp. LEGE 07203]|uniref:DALR domain-containing protein n=1 Tax=Tychonema sp. LEGE 07203 TaxID=1828671 RepID=UPI0019E57DA2|nr:cysteine--tRNA ligase [Tychonema sp. LEGE 07203]
TALGKGGSQNEDSLGKGGSKNEDSLGKGGSKKEGSEKSKAVEPMAVRLFVFMAHYRSQIDFTEEAIASARNGWNTIAEGLLFGLRYADKLSWDVEKTGQDTDAVQQFQAAMDNDFNTPAALAVLFELAKELGKESNILVHQGKTETSPELLQLHWLTLVSLAGVLGLEVQPETETETAVGGLSDGEIEVMIQRRKDARKAKNFAEGDRLRNELQDKGITLIDQKDGTTIWHRS